MTTPGRNDPCPCGSGKKYKSCCMTRPAGTLKKKFKATLLSQPKQIDLMQRTYGASIAAVSKDDVPTPPSQQDTPLTKTEG